MVDLRALRLKIADATDPKAPLRVSRDWLEEVERDLTELQLRGTRELMPPARRAA